MSPSSTFFLLCFTLFSIVLGDDPFAVNTADFTDTTDKVFKGGPVDGIVAAFGDFDSDKRTDIFVLSENGHTVEVYFQEMEEYATLTKTKHNLFINRLNDTITSVVPGDFDGDSQMDVLITTKPNGQVSDLSVATSAFVYWGLSNEYTLGPITTVATDLKDQPLLMDYNADMIPDLFGVDSKGVRRFWTCNHTEGRDFFSVPLPVKGDPPPIRIPNSNAFLDLTGNYAADLLVTSLGEGAGDKTQFETWELIRSDQAEEEVWEQTGQPYELPPGPFAHVGQSSFADMTSDGKLDHILPVCIDAKCQNSFIYMRPGGDKDAAWTVVLNVKEAIGDVWGFVPPANSLAPLWAYIPITVRVGDTNMDSYPDIICILQSGTNSTRRVFVLENDEGKTLMPIWDIQALYDIQMPILATFMDLTHTGILDIIVVNQSKPDREPQIHVIKNNFAVDAYFLKAHILSGLCFNNCPGLSTKPYGVNQPGPFVHYSTTSSTGAPKLGAAAQLSQSAYLSLQLPYIVMGLGQNPNYLDYLTMSIPSAVERDGKNLRQHTFASIIPNSEVIAIPYPLDEPEEWKSVLLISPGKSVVVTGGVLVGTCVFMAIVVGILQLLEKREDDREKRQESHRFHFDAM